MDIFERLYGVVLDRKANPSPDSYVCRLLDRGEDKILQKVGEEAVETVLAAKSGSREALVRELADLAFHCVVLLGSRGIPPAEVAAELERRFGTSGVAEKASRGAHTHRPHGEKAAPGREEPRPMKICSASEMASFSADKARKVPLAEGHHARVTLWCLEAGQEIHPHAHAGDHVWVVQEGKGLFLTEGASHAVSAGSVVFAPSGEPHGMRAETRLVFTSVSAG